MKIRRFFLALNIFHAKIAAFLPNCVVKCERDMVPFVATAVAVSGRTQNHGTVRVYAVNKSADA